MQEPTPLIETDDMAAMTAATGQAQPTAGGQVGADTQPVEFTFGGAAGQPAVRVGSLTLGYQDILLVLVLLQAVTATLAAINLSGGG
ncbi:hypothetical protein [Salinirussus salinus]|uniref:hypothetical protein n=1 Tax=Salinirussus salinus TaxID=1198300 RepID=UPI00135C2A33|nr:hypothetical protein [Salinirussus salinus]